MKNLIPKIILISLLYVTCMGFAFASKIIYVNGIQNSQDDAVDTAKRLAKELESHVPRLGFNRPTEIIVVWNKIGFDGSTWTEFDLDQDLQELFVSKANEEFYAADFNKIKVNHKSGRRSDLDIDAAKRIVDRITTELPSISDPIARLYQAIHDNLAKGEQIVVVAHSQGNLIANFAWAKAISIEPDLAFKNLRIVNVANTARRSPNDFNFTHAGDAALFYRADSVACPENSLQNLPRRKGWKRVTPVCYGEKKTDSSICDFLLSAPTFKASNSGSGSFDSGAPIGGGIDACLDHSIVLTYMSDAVVEVDIDQSVDFSTDKSFKQRLIDFIYQGLKSISDANLQLNFEDQFTGTFVDTSKWNIVGPVSLSNDYAQFGTSGSIDTKGKVAFSGSQIVVEARMAGQGSGRDTAILLIDQNDPSAYVVAHDTSYCGWGMAFSGNGPFELTTGAHECGGGSNVVHVGASTNQFMEYRLTIRGADVLFERGPTLANITESLTTKLTSSIEGRALYLLIGTAGPGYSPGTFDWVRVLSPTPVSVNGLLAKWSFNGTFADTSGNANNGTGVDMSFVADRCGRSGSAVRFNGTSSWISVPDSSSLRSPNTALSASVWIRGGGPFFPIFIKTDGPSNDQYQYRWFYFSSWESVNFGLPYQNGFTPIAAATVTDGRWHHLGMSFDGLKTDFYFDGTKVGSYSMPGVIVPNFQRLEIGRESNGPIEWMNGDMDDLLMFSRALSAAEMSALASAACE